MISLCDMSGRSCLPWALSGYECVAVDVVNDGRTEYGIEYLRLSVFDAECERLVRDADFISVFPPCTDLAVSGARHFRRKGMRRLITALELVERVRHLCEEVARCPFYIENPVSTLATYWRQPDFKFHPHDFAGYYPDESEQYTKLTCVWTGNGFTMPAVRSLPPVQGSKMHRIAPGPRRAALRSLTPLGWSVAVCRANRKAQHDPA